MIQEQPAALTEKATQSASHADTSSSVRMLMNNMLETNAQRLWKAVRYVLTEDNVAEDVVPVTDDDWARLRESAITLLEAGNALLLPGRVVDHEPAPADYPDWQYTPEEIQTLKDSAPEGWSYYVEQMQFSTRETLETIERRDVLAFMEKSGVINNACQGCHGEFWYKPQGQ
jgi:hypothetical protein